MVKRLLLASILVAGCAGASSVSPATAGCTAENRGGSAGEYATATVTRGVVTIRAWQYGNFISGPAFACSDGTFGADSRARGGLEIIVGGDVVCASSAPLRTDPFLFGAIAESESTDPCGASVTFETVVETVDASPDDVIAGPEGVSASVRKYANGFGEYWLDGTTYAVNGWDGHFTKGVKAASEH